MYSIDGYDSRAMECARLANQTPYEVIQRELLNLRQTCLKVAQRLREQGFGSSTDRV